MTGIEGGGPRLRLLADRYADALQHETRIIRAQSGEFVVPDVPARLMVPLHFGQRERTILQSNVAAINRIVRATSQEFFSLEISRAARSESSRSERPLRARSNASRGTLDRSRAIEPKTISWKSAPLSDSYPTIGVFCVG